MVLEAVTLRVQREDREAQAAAEKEAKRAKWREEEQERLKQMVR